MNILWLYPAFAILGGFLLDLCLGDPQWLPHPIRLIGWAISALERRLRALFPKSPRGELAAGAVLAAILLFACWLLPVFLLELAGRLHPSARLALETWMCYQILAVKDLRTESLAVYRRLMAQDLPGARQAVSRIVGRDTQALTMEGVTKAAVETVAENTCDGVIAPLFFLALGGAPLGFLYKAVNTMDSMIGYRNDKYLYFGRAGARLDDIANYLPARIAALLFVAAAPFCRLDAKGAFQIWRRDHALHASPNSAHTEAACAGALGVSLAGDAVYGGVIHKKHTLGDQKRPIEPADILRANRLMLAAAVGGALIAGGVRLLLFLP